MTTPAQRPPRRHAGAVARTIVTSPQGWHRGQLHGRAVAVSTALQDLIRADLVAASALYAPTVAVSRGELADILNSLGVATVRSIHPWEHRRSVTDC